MGDGWGDSGLSSIPRRRKETDFIPHYYSAPWLPSPSPLSCSICGYAKSHPLHQIQNQGKRWSLS